IVWFLRVTMTGAAEVGTAAAVLLSISVLAGLVHLGRAVGDQAAALSPSRGHRAVMVGWMVLFLFVFHRMGDDLGGGCPAMRRMLGMVAAAAAYGFSAGAVRSFRFATLNLIKLPLLIGISVSVAAGAYFLAARLLAPELGFPAVRRLVLSSYADLAK